MSSLRAFDRGGRGPAAQLEALAGPLELERVFEDAAPVALAGHHRGVPVRLELEGGEVRIRIRLEAPLPPGLRLSSRRGLARAARARGIRLGDAALEKRIQAESENPAAAIRILREPSLKAPLEALFSRPGVVLEDGELRLTCSAATLEAVRPALSDAVALAPALEEAARRIQQAHAENVREVRSAGVPELGGRHFVARETDEALIERIHRETYARGRANAIWTALLMVPTAAAMCWLSIVWERHSHFDDAPGALFFLGLFVAYQAAKWIREGLHCAKCNLALFRHELRHFFRARRCPWCGTRLR